METKDGSRSTSATSESDAERFLQPPGETMRAIFYEEYGDAKVLKLGDVPVPKQRVGQVLIRVMATSVNPIDWRIRRGDMQMLLRGQFPRIPGYDIAGYVIDPGADITLNRGDRVMGFLDSVYGGAYAQFVACSHESITLIPSSLSFEEAAAIPLAGSTALQSLRRHGRLKAGERVLINGSSGGVGGFAVQIAKHDGAHVTAVSSGINEPYAKSLGADEFIDYHETDFTKLSEKWDVIFDAAGKSSFFAAQRVLRSGGRYVSTEPSLKGAILSLATKLTSKRCRVMLARPRREDLSELVRLHVKGVFKAMVDDVMPVSDAVQAHMLSEQGKLRGKLVLRMVG